MSSTNPTKTAPETGSMRPKKHRTTTVSEKENKEGNKKENKKESKNATRTATKCRRFWESNIVREMSTWFNRRVSLQGNLYLAAHSFIMFLAAFVLLFSSSLAHLAVLLLFVSLDAIAIVFRHECPLTALERKYLGITGCELRNMALREAGIVYRCEHDYEKQVELLINVWTMVATKMLCIAFLRQVQWPIFDYGGIYLSAPAP